MGPRRPKRKKLPSNAGRDDTNHGHLMKIITYTAAADSHDSVGRAWPTAALQEPRN